MISEDEIREEITDFLERTCISEFIFEQAHPAELLKIKKKTPIGTWKIKSAELGYFINENDQVIVCILKKGTPEEHPFITRILTAYAIKSH